MDAVRKDIEKLVAKELESANKKFPLFRSYHEAAAVMLEEVEELEDATDWVRAEYDDYWYMVKHDMEISRKDLMELRDAAISTAVEAIQVATMAEKAILSKKGIKENDHTNRTKDN